MKEVCMERDHCHKTLINKRTAPEKILVITTITIAIKCWW